MSQCQFLFIVPVHCTQKAKLCFTKYAFKLEGGGGVQETGNDDCQIFSCKDCDIIDVHVYDSMLTE